MEDFGRSFNHLIQTPYNKQMQPTNFPLRSKFAADLRRYASRNPGSHCQGSE